MTKTEREEFTSIVIELSAVLTEALEAEFGIESTINKIEFVNYKGCSYHGKIRREGEGRWTIILNWKLLTSDLLKYVIAHEAAHIKYWEHDKSHADLTQKFEDLLTEWTYGRDIAVPE